MFNISPQKTAVITIATDDKVSAEVNLQHGYKKLLVLIPTLTSSAISVSISDRSGGTYYPVHKLKSDLSATGLQSLTAGTGAVAMAFAINGAQYVKIVAAASQGADRTFIVWGMN